MWRTGRRSRFAAIRKTSVYSDYDRIIFSFFQGAFLAFIA